MVAQTGYLITTVLMVILSGQSMAHASQASSNPLIKMLVEISQGSEPISRAQEVKVASALQQEAGAYLAKVREIGPPSLRGRDDIRAETGASLILEAQGIEDSLVWMIRWLRLVQLDPRETAVPWLHIVEAMSTQIEEIADMERFELVESDWPRHVSLFLPHIFSRILIPKVTDLAERNIERAEPR